MLLFSFLLLALLLVSYCFYRRDKKVIPIIVMGVISAVLVCSFKTLFLYSHRVIPYVFVDNYLYLLVRQTVLPLFILYFLFLAFSKDTLEFKFNSFLPLELSFYSVFLPHVIVSSSEGMYSGFSLFVKPLLYAVMLVQTGIFMNGLFKSLQKKKIFLVILLVLGILVYICIPALLETIFLIRFDSMILLLGCIVYSIIPVLCILFVALKKK